MTAMVEGGATLIGSATGVALAHSMGGHQCSMHQLGRQLAALGHRVLSVCLRSQVSLHVIAFNVRLEELTGAGKPVTVLCVASVDLQQLLERPVHLRRLQLSPVPTAAALLCRGAGGYDRPDPYYPPRDPGYPPRQAASLAHTLSTDCCGCTPIVYSLPGPFTVMASAQVCLASPQSADPSLTEVPSVLQRSLCRPWLWRL